MRRELILIILLLLLEQIPLEHLDKDNGVFILDQLLEGREGWN